MHSLNEADTFVSISLRGTGFHHLIEDDEKCNGWVHESPLRRSTLKTAECWNVPTTHQPIIRQSRETGERELVQARWDLVPYFTKDLKDVKGLSTINARSETIAQAPIWREPFKKRRCLVPMSSYYEWPKAGKPPKRPYLFELANAQPMALAGLWDARGLAAILRHRNYRNERADEPDTLAHGAVDLLSYKLR